MPGTGFRHGGVRFFRWLAALAAGGLTALVLTPSAKAACVVNVPSWDVLNMRAGPGVRHRIVGAIPPDACGVRITWPCRGRWCKVRWRGREGFVHMRYISEEADADDDTACVVRVAPWDGLNMRAGPGVSYPVVAIIPPDACDVRIRPFRAVGNWWRVRWRGMTGWVNRRYLGW
ncbi:SH3 domain-containing protein [Thermopetrobacter sp. TC1]|uniref:SH3 domain-containing protein n=1 Tax=Thermopetrobacter sp. TC1 TaxID=1495045 RepID=UPI0009DCE5B7|nr:SH3 domain-containing protein [Thermopetrobacter sp. TC1]